ECRRRRNQAAHPPQTWPRRGVTAYSYSTRFLAEIHSTPMRWVGDSICIAVLIGLCFFFGLPRYKSNLDLSDEGLLAYGAVRVTQGQVPNRDFVSLHGPLSFYTASAVFKIFGT